MLNGCRRPPAPQLVDSERDDATIWIARAAPRRWYAAAATNDPPSQAADGTPAGPLFSAVRAPSRWGTVGFSFGPQHMKITEVNVTVEFEGALGAVV